MVQLDIRQTTTTDMTSKVTDFSVAPQQTDAAGDQDETTWDNTKWPQYFAYYKKIPEYKTALNAFATWVLGKGFLTDPRNTVILEAVTGWGEDTFQSILWNMLVCKKLGGDAFAEIMRDEETGVLINLKPLDPGSIRIVANKKGRIKRYEQVTKTGDSTTYKTIKVRDMLHLCNDRVADEIHGTSITESVEWVILARNEAMTDWRRILHRSTIRVMEVDEDDPERLANLKRDYADAVKKGELMFVPKGSGEFKDLVPPPGDTFISWIKYLENFFYQALGVPKVILGGSEEFTEASSKIGYLTFEQIYLREVTELKADLLNQLGVRLEFNKPASLKNEMLSSEEKNTGQVGFQPNDTIIGSGKA